MKKKLLLFFLINVLLQNAQNLQGIVEYQYKKSMKDMQIKMDGIGKEAESEMQDVLKKAFEKKMILDFNGLESLYGEEEKLETPTFQSGLQMRMSGGPTSKKYKNIQTNERIEEVDFFGKEFLLIDTLTKPQWTITQESKQIGNYMCIKATYLKIVPEEVKKRFKEINEKNKDNTTNFMIMPEPKDTEIVAWFTPEIPLGHGPDIYFGLPGLILEVQSGTDMFLASKVTVNPKDKIKIKKPKKGEVVTADELKKIREDKLNSMKDEKGNIKIETIEFKN
jgi:GLPGLI family protein